MNGHCDYCGKDEITYRYWHVELCRSCGEKFGPSRAQVITKWDLTDADKKFLHSLRISTEG